MSHHRQHQNAIGKSARNRIHHITGLQVQHLISKLDAILPLLPPTLPLRQLVFEQDHTPGEVSGNGGKHVLQECSILGHLRRIGAFGSRDASKQRLMAIEFGAGTGRLSERLQRTTSEDMIHVMIDRQDFAPSQCRDGRMRRRAVDVGSIRRIVGDIADLDIGEYCHPAVETEQSRCFCMSKHLCGPACDLAIAALERVAPPLRRPPFAFATCCHYLCTFDVFAGKDYWIELGLTETDFEVAVAVSQWYSLKKPADIRLSQPDESSNACAENEPALPMIDFRMLIKNASFVLTAQMSSTHPRPVFSPSEEFERNFSSKDKSKLGEDVKLLLDMVRLAKLQELGYDAELILYTNRSIENRLLVGKAGID